MSSAEFSSIVKDLSLLRESVRIKIGKGGVQFVSNGEGGNGSVLLKETDAARERYMDGDAWEASQQEAEAEEEGGKKVKEEDGDINIEGDGEDKGKEEFKPDSNDEEDKSEKEGSVEEEEASTNRMKRKKAPAKVCFIVLILVVFDTYLCCRMEHL
jgi:proliferating cell nuclear antigen